MSRRLACLVRHLDEIACGVLLVAIVALLGVTVTLRYAFAAAYAPADELVGFAFVWFVYLSMVVATRKGRHFRVELAVAALPGRARLAARALADLVWLGVNLVVVVQGVSIVAAMHRFKSRSPMLGWSMEYPYLVIPVSFALASIHVVVWWVDVRRGRRGGAPGR